MTPVFRCKFCDTLFEKDVADPGPGGAPRCPQCGLTKAEPAMPSDDDFVVCTGMQFR